MKTKINITGDWLLIESETSSMRVKSSMRGVEDKILDREANDLLIKLGGMKKREEISDLLSKEKYWPLSIIYDSDNFTIIKSDIVRSAPLFYQLESESFLITDRLPMNLQLSLDQASIHELIETNHVSGSHTLYKNVNALQPAEIIFFEPENPDFSKSRYFKYNVGKKPEIMDLSNVEIHAKTLDGILTNTFRDIIDSIPKNGRVIVPLSGGHDSRIVVNYLYKLGFKKVICYTYGMPGNKESVVSRDVADTLNYEWHFIEYTPEKWGELHDDGVFDNYIEFACNGVSNPHLQDFLAVYELDKLGVIKKDDVFIPGHGFDVLCHTIDYSTYNGSLLENVIDRFFWNKNKFKFTSNSLKERILQIFKESDVFEEDFLDYLMWSERQAKFTINSFRVYEFFGYEARAPFWDSKLVEFCLEVDKKIKYTRDFVIKMEQEELLVNELQNVAYSKERVINRRKKASIKNKLIPNLLKVILLRFTKKKQYQNEGLNLIYSEKADSVRELLDMQNQWPKSLRKTVKKDLYRYPFQINHHYLTRLYTINMLLRRSG